MNLLDQYDDIVDSIIVFYIIINIGVIFVIFNIKGFDQVKYVFDLIGLLNISY